MDGRHDIAAVGENIMKYTLSRIVCIYYLPCVTVGQLHRARTSQLVFSKLPPISDSIYKTERLPAAVDKRTRGRVSSYLLSI